MAAKRSDRHQPRPRRSSTGADEVGAEYMQGDADEDVVAGDSGAEPASARPVEAESDGEDMPSGTVQDQLVYEGLEANRPPGMPPLADPRRARRRSPLRSRTAPAPRAAKPAKPKAKTRTKR